MGWRHRSTAPDNSASLGKQNINDASELDASRYPNGEMAGGTASAAQLFQFVLVALIRHSVLQFSLQVFKMRKALERLVPLLDFGIGQPS